MGSGYNGKMMVDELRKPFLIAVLVLMVLVVSLELGGGLGVTGSYAGNICNQLPDDDELRDECDPDEINDLKEDVPGLGIAYLALIDGIFLFALGLIVSPLLLSHALHGRIQGIITLIFALLLLIAAIMLIFTALAKLLVMVGLFLSAPFGTIAYFAIYAFFPRAGAAAVLSGVMLFKVIAIVCVLLAQQRFLQNKGLVLLILASLLGNLVVGLLHGLVPTFLVSITDALAAIVVGVIAAILLLILLIASIPAIFKAIA